MFFFIIIIDLYQTSEITRKQWEGRFSNNICLGYTDFLEIYIFIFCGEDNYRLITVFFK